MSKIQHGSSFSDHANRRDSTDQDPRPDTSSGSINEHFKKLNISEDTCASTATMNTDKSHEDGSTTIDQDAPSQDAYGQSSPHSQHGFLYPPFQPYPYGSNPYGFTYPPGFPMGPGHPTSFPMYDVPPQGPTPAYPMPVNQPSGHPTSFPMLGVNPFLPGYNPYGYPYQMAPMPSSPLKNHSEGDKIKLHPEDSSSTKNRHPGSKTHSTYFFPYSHPDILLSKAPERHNEGWP